MYSIVIISHNFVASFGLLIREPILKTVATQMFISLFPSFLSLFSFTQRNGAVPTRRMWDGHRGGGVCFATPPRLWFLVGLFVCLLLLFLALLRSWVFKEPCVIGWTV